MTFGPRAVAWHQSQVSDQLASATELASIPDRSHKSVAVAGVDLRTVEELMGHKTITNDHDDVCDIHSCHCSISSRQKREAREATWYSLAIIPRRKQRETTYADNSPRRARARARSGVSKPSVNQLYAARTMLAASASRREFFSKWPRSTAARSSQLLDAWL